MLAAALVRIVGKRLKLGDAALRVQSRGCDSGNARGGVCVAAAFGVRTTIAVAAALNVIVGVIAIIAAPAQTRVEPEVRSRKPWSCNTDRAGFWFFAALASGFVTISTQVSWTRILTMIIGSSTYAFSIVVALFLIGLAGGAWFVARKDRSRITCGDSGRSNCSPRSVCSLSLFVVNKLPGCS